MSSSQSSTQNYDFIIIGGGVYGICIAYYLTKYKTGKILLLEQYEIGHTNGSSHSPTRITRSTYEKQLYRDLNLKALKQNWPELQKLLNFKFVYQTPYIYYDEQEHSYEQFKKVAKGADNFAFLSPEQVCTKYPGMPLIKSRFPPIVDLKAGILTADDFILKLKQYLIQNQDKLNLTIKQNTKVTKVSQTQKGVQIQTQSGVVYSAKKAIVASGKWVTELVPEIRKNFKVIKQYVSYLELKDMPKYDITKFYSFYYKEKDDLHFFSMADHKAWGVKLGHHNLFNLPAQQDNWEYQQKFFEQKGKQIFGEQFVRINKIQNCYYTITGSHDFVIDWVNPMSEKIMVCSCCSGHGFKFAPILGDVIAQLIKSNKDETQNKVYNQWKHMFKLAYHEGMNLQG